MQNRTFIVSIGLFIFILSLNSYEKQGDWRQIVVGQSTQADVERIIGKPRTDINSDSVLSFFRVKDGYLSIYYSTGFCEPQQRGGWNLAEGIVDEISFSPFAKIKFKSLKLDRKKYKKIIEGDDDRDKYFNDQSGIKYIVTPKGIVSHIVFYPRSELQCTVFNKLPEITTEPSMVTDLSLGSAELITGCRTADSGKERSCPDASMIIPISVSATNITNVELLDYVYEVSGGKIIGTGEKVMWDLSDVKPGTYTISIRLNNSIWMRFGNKMTKEVVVKECPDCFSTSK